MELDLVFTPLANSRFFSICNGFLGYAIAKASSFSMLIYADPVLPVLQLGLTRQSSGLPTAAAYFHR